MGLEKLLLNCSLIQLIYFSIEICSPSFLFNSSSQISIGNHHKPSASTCFVLSFQNINLQFIPEEYCLVGDLKKEAFLLNMPLT